MFFCRTKFALLSISMYVAVYSKSKGREEILINFSYNKTFGVQACVAGSMSETTVMMMPNGSEWQKLAKNLKQKMLKMAQLTVIALPFFGRKVRSSSFFRDWCGINFLWFL